MKHPGRLPGTIPGRLEISPLRARSVYKMPVTLPSSQNDLRAPEANAEGLQPELRGHIELVRPRETKPGETSPHSKFPAGSGVKVDRI